MPTQTRVVLNPSVQPIAEEIRVVTSASSLSEVMTLLLSRYGSHFIAWWQSNPHQLELSAITNSQTDFSLIQQTDVDLSVPIEL